MTTRRYTVMDPHEMHEPRYIVACAFMGAANSGKTTMIHKFKYRSFEATRTTIGVDYVDAHLSVEEEPTRLIIYDTAGTERFGSITRAYLRNVHVIFLVFSYDNEDSFLDLSEQRRVIRESAPFAIVVLVASKADLIDDERAEWTVKYDIRERSKQLDCAAFFSVSATSGESDSADAPFVDAAALYIEKRRGEAESEQRRKIELNSASRDSKKCCH